MSQPPGLPLIAIANAARQILDEFSFAWTEIAIAGLAGPRNVAGPSSRLAGPIDITGSVAGLPGCGSIGSGPRFN
jgi:hypothetical protein